MKILVLVKAARTLADDEFEVPEGSIAIDAEELEAELNEWDATSLEQAVRLREQGHATEVVAVTVDDDAADEVLYACLAQGADRAVRIDAEVGDGDPLMTASLVAAFARGEEPQLILAGAQSSDAVNGAVGSAVAGKLDMALVAVVTSVEPDPEAATLTVERELEGGTIETLRVRTREMPVVLTMQTGSVAPRYANLRAIKQARRQEIAVVEAEGLDVGPDDAGWVPRGLHTRVETDAAQMLDGDTDAVAARVREIIEEALA